MAVTIDGTEFIEFIECGECGGCKAKAAIAAAVAQVDEVFLPRIKAVGDSYRALPYRDERTERKLRLQAQGIMEERSRWIRFITEPLAAMAGCYRLIIRTARAA